MGTRNEVPAGQWAGRRDIFEAIVTGAITLPEFRTVTVNGEATPVLKFSVCSNKVRKNADGSSIQYAEFPRVAVWGALATTLASLLTKGSIVVVKGDLRSNTYKSTKYFALAANSGQSDPGNPASFTSWEINVGRSGSVNIMYLQKEGAKAVNDQPAAAATGIPAATEVAALLKGIQAIINAGQASPPDAGKPFNA